MASADTIFALASGQGRAGVAVVRVSGPAASTLVRHLTRTLPAPRRATLLPLRDPHNDELLDHGLVLWFPAPNSFTGEDCAELQVHGSRAVIAGLFEACAALPGVRLAEPGEFTRRAFLNGKMDLTAVEGLADLIDADTDAQRRQALRQFDGALGRWADDLRADLLQAIALAEAAIDFADEGDIGDRTLADACQLAAEVRIRIGQELRRPRQAERIRDGFVITFAGPPNAGKSTLMNAIARRDVAIVSPHAGTTRDPIEVDLDLGGYAVQMIDTAGIRDTADPVEQEGVARARARAAQADLVLWLQESSELPAPPSGFKRLWTVGTKADLQPTHDSQLGARSFDVVVSAATGLGLEELIVRITGMVSRDLGGGEAGLLTQARHRAALAEAAATLDQVRDFAGGPELVAEDLRKAAQAIGRIAGRIDVEDVLGAIFARFCVGK